MCETYVVAGEWVNWTLHLCTIHCDVCLSLYKQSHLCAYPLSCISKLGRFLLAVEMTGDVYDADKTKNTFLKTKLFRSAERNSKGLTIG